MSHGVIATFQAGLSGGLSSILKNRGKYKVNFMITPGEYYQFNIPVA